MAGNNDIWDLVKSGLSLFANVFDAAEKRAAGQSYNASALRAGSDLASIVGTVSRMSSNAKQSTEVAVSTSSLTIGGHRVTSIWENPDLTMGVSYNPQTSYFVVIYPRLSGVGYNFYYGAAIQQGNSLNALTLGTNSLGERLAFRIIVSGNALYMHFYNLDTGEPGEVLFSRH